MAAPPGPAPTTMTSYSSMVLYSTASGPCKCAFAWIRVPRSPLTWAYRCLCPWHFSKALGNRTSFPLTVQFGTWYAGRGCRRVSRPGALYAMGRTVQE